MVPLDYMLAAALLMLPPSCDNAPALSEHTCLAATLRVLAANEECLDQREESYLFRRPEAFSADLALVQRRRRELSAAPALSDVERFAPRNLVVEWLAFNRAYRKTLVLRRDAGDPDPEIEQALREVDQLYRLWDLVREARSCCYYVSVRRQALLALREALGPEDYHTARMPPTVPVWRFRLRD